MESPRILIADDQAHVLEALELLLKNEGFVSEAVNSPAAADPSRRGDAVCARARPGRSRQMSRGSTARRWRPPWG